ncbi:MAG: PAS domain S-box protein, partial [Deltaproteobacteria bacterium]|nr:PAS domain S-box protein [Deltaproteobacteria bacterium]
MKDESKTERQLVQELIELRRQVAEMEKIEAERKRTEEALRESEKRYREVVESAAEIIHTTDIQGNFTFANAASLRAAGTSLEESKQLNYLDIIHPDHRQRLAEIYINQFRERKATIYVEFPILSRSGEVIWLGQNSSLMFEGKKVVGFHSVARDITERKQMEETLRRSEEEAKRLAQENALVAEVGRIIGSTPNIDEVFERFSKAVTKLIPFDRIVINLRGPQEDDSFVRYVA